jgi:hypothetical protein
MMKIFSALAFAALIPVWTVSASAQSSAPSSFFSGGLTRAPSGGAPTYYIKPQETKNHGRRTASGHRYSDRSRSYRAHRRDER